MGVLHRKNLLLLCRGETLPIQRRNPAFSQCFELAFGAANRHLVIDPGDTCFPCGLGGLGFGYQIVCFFFTGFFGGCVLRPDHRDAGHADVVLLGIGITLISKRAVEDECHAQLLHCVRIQDLRVARSFYLVTHRDRSRSPLATAFLEFVESQFPAGAS